ncbi:hypothetical protein BH09ACT8_BH09ACT8_35060 [soil metagenome]
MLALTPLDDTKHAQSRGITMTTRLQLRSVDNDGATGRSPLLSLVRPGADEHVDPVKRITLRTSLRTQQSSGTARPARLSVGQVGPQTTYPSATVNAASRMPNPSATSASVMLQAGTAWIRLKFANGSRPPDLQAAMTAFIAGLLPP